MNKEKIKEFLKLIEENPELPIYAWVAEDIVCDDSFAYWLGEFSFAKVCEYVNFEMYGDNKIIEDPEEIIEYLFNIDERDIPDDEIETEIKERVKNLNWRKAIFVYVNTPDSMQEDVIKEEL